MKIDLITLTSKIIIDRWGAAYESMKDKSLGAVESDPDEFLAFVEARKTLETVEIVIPVTSGSVTMDLTVRFDGISKFIHFCQGCYQLGDLLPQLVPYIISVFDDRDDLTMGLSLVGLPEGIHQVCRFFADFKDSKDLQKCTKFLEWARTFAEGGREATVSDTERAQAIDADAAVDAETQRETEAATKSDEYDDYEAAANAADSAAD
jgi:hypothetical protein